MVFRLRGERNCADAARAHKRDGHQGFHPCESRFLYFLVWRRLPTCDRCEIGERQSGYHNVNFVKYSQFTDSVLLHIRATLRWVRHNSAARFVSALLQTRPAKINCAKRLIRTRFLLLRDLPGSPGIPGKCRSCGAFSYGRLRLPLR